jgi:hypothetical protein
MILSKRPLRGTADVVDDRFYVVSRSGVHDRLAALGLVQYWSALAAKGVLELFPVRIPPSIGLSSPGTRAIVVVCRSTAEGRACGRLENGASRQRRLPSWESR